MFGNHSKGFICAYWDMKVETLLNGGKIFALLNGRQVQVQVATASVQDYNC